uniref:Uncharacterized protein n=1 Tax=Arundo donax TaxID=35708 RepID=A0A0A9CDY0_ARUDO
MYQRKKETKKERKKSYLIANSIIYTMEKLDHRRQRVNLSSTDNI